MLVRLAVIATPVPALASANTPVTEPVTVAVSLPKRPIMVGVPLKVALVLALYTLLAADKPLIVTGAAEMLAVIPVG